MAIKEKESRKTALSVPLIDKISNQFLEDLKNLSELNILMKPPIFKISTLPNTNLGKKYDIIKKCKKILERNGTRYTDEEILKIREILYELAELDVALYNQLHNINQPTDTYKPKKVRKKE